MRLFLGIDLGSTTSKAVLLDESGATVGRGLTNTRSNYDVAAQVARAEAEVDARFALLGRGLAKDVVLELERAFRLEKAVRRLVKLEERMHHHSSSLPADARRGVAAILEGMRANAEDLLGELAQDRTRFFRDVVGAVFRHKVEEAAARRELSFELAQGVFDRAILEIENELEERGFDELMESATRRARIDEASRSAARDVVRSTAGTFEVVNMVGTGYGRARLPFGKDQIRSEILCHGLGAHSLFPQTRTVLDIGGQDTKAIQVDDRGIVTSFQMNDRCAAGCGRYLGYIADEMNLALHQLGPMAMEATRGVRITSTCTVFAGLELRDLLAVGEKRENILLGLHRAIMLRAMSLLARSGGVFDELTFTGGVAKNAAAVAALRELVQRNYGERILNIHPDSIYTGAIGAALFALRGTPAEA